MMARARGIATRRRTGHQHSVSASALCFAYATHVNRLFPQCAAYLWRVATCKRDKANLSHFTKTTVVSDAVQEREQNDFSLIHIGSHVSYENIAFVSCHREKTGEALFEMFTRQQYSLVIRVDCIRFRISCRWMTFLLLKLTFDINTKYSI